MEKQRTESLIAKWFDETISPDEAKELEQLLETEPSARRLFKGFASVDVLLRESAAVAHNAMDQPTGAVASMQATSKPQQAVPAQSAAPVLLLGPKSVQAWGLRLGGAVAAAALIVLVVMALEKDHRQDQLLAYNKNKGAGLNETPCCYWPPAPVATLASSTEAVWEESAIPIGHFFKEGDTFVLKSGEAFISVGYGAEIAAQGPCEVEFVAKDRIRLLRGTVVVDVASWAKGFTVSTESMDVVDLGTMFSVSASGKVESNARVLKGMVRVSPATQGSQHRSLLVSEGHAVKVDKAGIHRIAKEHNEANPPNNLVSKNVPFKPVELHNSGLGLRVGDEDQHWQIVAGPKGFRGPQYATVCRPHYFYMENDSKSSQWISTSKWLTAAPDAIYTFQTAFDLTDYDVSTIQLFGRFLADNGVKQVRVNGKPVEVEGWVDYITVDRRFDSEMFRLVNISTGLVQGPNTVEIDVYNGVLDDPRVPNPMALRVEWYAFGRPINLATHASHSERAFQPLVTSSAAIRTGELNQQIDATGAQTLPR